MSLPIPLNNLIEVTEHKAAVSYRPKVNPRGIRFSVPDLYTADRPLGWLINSRTEARSTLDKLNLRFTFQTPMTSVGGIEYDAELRNDSPKLLPEAYLKYRSSTHTVLLNRREHLLTDVDQLVLTTTGVGIYDLSPALNTSGVEEVWSRLQPFFKENKHNFHEGCKVGLFRTGNSYHLYTTQDYGSVGKLAAVVLSGSSNLFDHKWLVCVLARGYGGLRLSPKAINGEEIWPTLAREGYIRQEGALWYTATYGSTKSQAPKYVAPELMPAPAMPTLNLDGLL